MSWRSVVYEARLSFFGRMAQMGAHLHDTQEVVGSRPAASTKATLLPISSSGWLVVSTDLIRRASRVRFPG